MITAKLATLSLGLALALAGAANAAQPLDGTAAAPLQAAPTQPVTGQPVATSAGAMKTSSAKIGATKIGTTETGAAKLGEGKLGERKSGAVRTSKAGTRIGTPKLSSGRSVAVQPNGSHKLAPMHRRLHVSLLKAKLHRVHVAHVAKKVPGKHA